MSTNNALTILGDGYNIAISPEAEQQKQTILHEARAVLAVTDSDSCDIAQARIKGLAAMRIAVDKSREIVKRPVIELGRTIDGIARDFAAEVIAEEARLTGLVNEYAREQQRIAREAAAKAEAERQRIEREEHEKRMAALRAEQEAERQRMEAERQKHEAEMAKLRAARQADAQAEAEARQREEAAAQAQREAAARADAARLQAEQAAAEARRQEEAARAVVAPMMPNGAKEEIDFEVVDIVAFATKFPQLVMFIPKRANILAALKKSFDRNGKLPEVEGLRVFQNLRVRTR
jgi:hypothetical protein